MGGPRWIKVGTNKVSIRSPIRPLPVVRGLGGIDTGAAVAAFDRDRPVLFILAGSAASAPAVQQRQTSTELVERVLEFGERSFPHYFPGRPRTEYAVPIALSMPAGWTLRQIVSIGNHVGGPLSEVALRFDDQSGGSGVLSLSLAEDRSFWTTINIAEMSSDAESLFGVKAMPPWNGLATLNAQDFDLGRMRGTSSSFHVDGRNKVLLVGGRHIGAFPTSTTDISQAPLVMCNVTRYVGMLDSAPGAPGDLRLEWGWYFGYYQNAIENLPHILLGDGALVKRGYMAHGCIHRYDDSRLTSVQGRAAVAFSVFRVSSPGTQRTCEAEQRADYKARSAASNEAFLACIISTSGTVESTPTWAFTELGALPIQGAPHTQERGYDIAPPPFAQNKSGPNSRLVVRRNALAKGLMDFQLVSGRWIGYSPAEGRLVAK